MTKRKLNPSIDWNRGSGIEVYFENDWFHNSPKCRHGPMLLFESFAQGKSVGKRYYSCSASRDRKFCKAFISEEDHLSGKTINIEPIQKSKDLDYEEIKQLESCDCNFCLKCQTFLLKKDLLFHKEHDLKRNLSDKDLRCPSTLLLTPLENTKVNAQYFLSSRSKNFLLNTLINLKYQHVMCIGMPTLHELIQSKGNSASVLMDIDTRYKMFWSNEKFVHFNMFNRYFFSDVDQNSFNFFLKQCKNSKVAIVLDPPFGGLIDCVCETLKWINQQLKKSGANDISIFWLFPYFMEARIVANFGDITMLDYRVDYTNHKKFKNNNTGRKVSPVRIFTDVKNNLIPLPKDEGYKYCSKCSRYVYESNVHCDKCKTCPSKDGKTYIHCDLCHICVKPSWQHCKKCKRCQVKGHDCSKTRVNVGCHICGVLSHKRRNCPLRGGHKN